jgi:hypothetical protein
VSAGCVTVSASWATVSAGYVTVSAGGPADVDKAVHLTRIVHSRDKKVAAGDEVEMRHYLPTAGEGVTPFGWAIEESGPTPRIILSTSFSVRSAGAMSRLVRRRSVPGSPALLATREQPAL